MRRRFLLVFLLLVVKLRCSQSRCEDPESRELTSLRESLGLNIPKRNPMRRFGDLDYDSFVGLMGRRDADDANVVQQPQKNSGPWRRADPERRGIFVNKCRLRFLQGL
ncbi:tachykinin-3a isoform X2 [Syngnathus acus]|uniref:tachykinin-3a isoform X2 n=1 Tax=Syngnathus acus TaxID=161584 RepID=UPI00188609B1|nr:tachykinin-3a isoform X2 [Syngnathus acus]